MRQALRDNDTHTYPVLIIYYHQVSESKRSEELEYARQRRFLEIKSLG